MKSVVTGAAGFIGSHLVEKLLGAGHDVVGVDNFLDNYPRHFKENNLAAFRDHAKFTFVNEDLTRTDLQALLRDVGYVFHLAGQPGVRSSWGSEFSRYTENNISATQLLLEAAKDLNLGKFVYASTSSVYGDTTDLPMREDGLTRPVSPYGATKLAAEHLCHLYCKAYGVPTVALRFFTVYGPRQRPDMFFHIFMRALLNAAMTCRSTTMASRPAILRFVRTSSRTVRRGALCRPRGSVQSRRRLASELADAIAVAEKIAGIKAKLQRFDRQARRCPPYQRAVGPSAEKLEAIGRRVGLAEGLKQQWPVGFVHLGRSNHGATIAHEEDVGNIVSLEHVNVQIPDQSLATLILCRRAWVLPAIRISPWGSTTCGSTSASSNFTCRRAVLR